MSAQPRRLKFRDPEPEPTIKPREWREYVPPQREPHPYIKRRELKQQVATQHTYSVTQVTSKQDNGDVSTVLRPKNCCTKWAAHLKIIRRARKQRETEKRNKRQERQRVKVDQPDRRLPHGSRYETDFDETAQMWTGTLKTSVAGKPATFSATDAALMRLIPKLSRMYQQAKDAALQENR